MLVLIFLERQVLVIPPGKGARSFTNVALAVIGHTVAGHAHGEQLHDFAGKVLIRCALYVHARIQKRQHRRVLRRADQQVSEIAGALDLEQIKLALHLAVVAHFFFVVGKVPMPKQRHLFLQRRGRGQHAVGPPVGQAIRVQATGAQPVKKLVHHRLHAAVACGIDLDAQSLARGLGLVCHSRAAGGEWLQAGVVNAGFIKRREMAVGICRGRAGHVHYRFDRRIRPHRGVARNVIRRAAKAGALQQMGGAGGGPVLLADGREVIGPVVLRGMGHSTGQNRTHYKQRRHHYFSH